MILYLAMFRNICIMYIFILHKYDSLFRSSPPWVFLLEVSGEFAEWLPCRSVISIELLCSFVGVTLRRGCSINLLRIFRAPFCGSTYCYHFFVHDSQIFNILQLLLIICSSSYICVSCVHNLKLFFFFSIIEYDPNKLRFHQLE